MIRTPQEHELSFIYLLFKHGFLPTEVKEVFKLARRLQYNNLRISSDSHWSEQDDIKRAKLKDKLHYALRNIRHELGTDPRYYAVIIYRYDKDEIGIRI